MSKTLMAQNRKIDAGFFDQSWCDRLAEQGQSQYILLFIFLIVTCRNPIGVFEVNPRLWNFKLNPVTPFGRDDVFTVFGKRIRRIEGHPDKGIIVGFLDYQRSFGQNSTQWQWVERDLEAVGLTYEQLKQMDADSIQPELDLGMPPPLENKADKQPKEKPQRLIIPPKLEWVKAYCEERKNGIDAQSFIDFNTSRGWKVSNMPMKDWQAAIRTWEQRRKNDNPAAAQATAKTPVQNVAAIRRKF